MRDPTVGPLHGTFPGGILVLAVAISTVGPQVLSVHSVQAVVEVLAAIGIPLALAISLLFAYLLFTLEPPDTRVVNGGWFIPSVAPLSYPWSSYRSSPGSGRQLPGCCCSPGTRSGGWGSCSSCS